MRKIESILLCGLVVGVAACESPSTDPSLDTETSLYAVVETLDGIAFLPPLGPDPAPMGAAFDGSLLGGLSVVLEATSPTGAVRNIATFTQSTTPRLQRFDQFSVYFVDVPAAAYFTDPSSSYRFRAMSLGTEIGRSDLSSRVFAVLTKNPNLLIGVKVRVEQRPTPVATRIAPDSVVSGATDFMLTVTGSSFMRESVVRFGGTNLDTTFVSRGELRATVPGGLVLAPGTSAISVFTPAPGGGTSANVDFTVTPSVPVLFAITPSSAFRDATPFELTATGASFTRGSNIRLGETTLDTRFVNDERLVTTLPASALQAAAITTVTVVNPGGGTSEGRPFTVSNPAPHLTSITPASVLDTSAELTLTVDGSGFVAESSVRFDGTALDTTWTSSGRLLALVPRSALQTAGTRSVTVVNAGPGGGTSASATFTVNRPQPVITSLAPASVETNSATFSLTIIGTSFRAGAQVSFAGASLTTTFVSSTELTATVPSGLLTTGGTYGVTVANASPSVGASTPATFTVQNPRPIITSLSPDSGEAASGAFVLTILGSGFVRNGTVVFDGSAVGYTFVSPSELRASIPAAAIVTPGYDLVIVSSPAPGGGDSAPATYTSNHVTPTLTSITPSSATLGGNAFTLTLNGTNFELGATAAFNGATVTTSWVSSSRLTATIPASAIATAGVVNVLVNNPAPAVAPSAPQSFTINNPVPALSTVTPASALEGSASFTLTLDGGSFVAGSTALLDGAALATTYVSGSRLTATVPASAVAAAGTRTITVSSPTPGGGLSAARTFTVNRAAPVLTSLSPASTNAGGAAFTLTINGTGFQSGASATFNGTAVTTTFVSATQVTAAITATQIANGGNFTVTVSNAAPTVGASNGLTFTVNNLVPVLTSIAPTAGTAGSGSFTLTLNGTSFSNNATATFNGTAVTTTYVSATRLTAVIPAASIATSGTYAVTVTNPAPGGGTSGAQTYTVSNPAPVLSNISPISATSGSPGFTITAIGSSFVNGSQISFGGVTYTTTYVNAGQLTAAIPSAVLSSGGYREVVVTNPAPGGGTSGTQIFTVNTTPANINTSITIGDGGASMYAGSSVVVGNNAVITIATNNTVSFGSLELQAGSSIVTAPCTTQTCYCARISVGLDATIRANATINTDARGYLGGLNSGNTSAIGYTNGLSRPSNQANYYMGGSHGGYGGSVSDYGLGFTQIYDDALTPTLPGGGGNVYTSGNLGANGGGCVRLTVGGRLQLDGTITANGGGGSSFTSSGAGGSIWVTAPTIATNATGVIFQANGGGSSTYGSGGGGRIALYYSNASGWSPTSTWVQAYGGTHTNANYRGGSGTIYYTGPGSTNGNLLMTAPTGRNSTYRSARIGAFGTITALTSSVLTTSAPLIANALVGKTLVPNMYNSATFTISSNTETTITVSGGSLTSVAAVGNRFYVSDYVSTFDNVTIEGGTNLDTGYLNVSGTVEARDATSVTNYVVNAGTFNVRNTSVLTTWNATATNAAFSDSTTVTAQNVTATTLNVSNTSTLRAWSPANNVVYPMTLTTSNLTVDSGATITASGYGYLGGLNGGNTSVVGQAPGGITAPSQYYMGGHHGGWGGMVSDYGLAWGSIYDDVFQPTLAGGGGSVYTSGNLGGNGGGAINITASDTLTVNGSIQADGQGGSGYTSCGAGGAILVNAGTIATTTTNTLLLRANGASSCTYGGGGGGRIALYYNTLNGWSPSSTTVQTYGGSNSNANYNGGSGTIFYQGGGDLNGNLLLTTPTNRNSTYRRTRIGAFGTITALTSTVLTTSDPLIPNTLVGRTLVPNMYDSRRYVITGNTATTITVSTGGLTAGAAVGNRFYVADYATTFDNVYVDNAYQLDTGYLNIASTLDVRNTSQVSNYVTNATTMTVRNTANMTNWITTATSYDLSDSATMTTQSLTATTLNVNGTTTLRPWPPASNVVYPMQLTATNMSIATGATINLQGMGYLGGLNGGNTSVVGQAPSGIAAPVQYYMGGHHGGWGGMVSDYGLAYGSVYDDVYTPTLAGGGGSVYTSTNLGGNGGGAIRLDVSNNLALNGQINADGQGGSGYTSCGAGGAILVNAGSISSTSPTSLLLRANGASSCTYGGGGGGRIALYYTALTNWSPSSTTVQAYGGSNTNANYNGGTGTIFYRGAGSTNGNLLLTGPTSRNSSYRRTRIGAFGTISAITSTVLTTTDPLIPNTLAGKILVPNMNNAATYTIASNTATTITIASGSMTGIAAVGNRFYVQDYATAFDNVIIETGTNVDTGYLNLGSSLEVRNAAALSNFVTAAPTVTLRNTANMTTWNVNATTFGMNDSSTATALNITTTGALNVNNTSTLTTWGPSTTAVYTLTLNAGTMNVDSGATITVNGLGYLGGLNGNNTNITGYYNGNVVAPGRNYYLGGYHGGNGGSVSDYGLGYNSTYGSSTAPVTPGGGGNVYTSGQLGGNGGGVVRVIVSNGLTLFGLITANGQGGSAYTSAGAGGSIYVTAGTITGPTTALVLSANGGSGATYGKGGGGRIAIRGNVSGWTVSNATVQANGGTGSYAGTNGSIYAAP